MTPLSYDAVDKILEEELRSKNKIEKLEKLLTGSIGQVLSKVISGQGCFKVRRPGIDTLIQQDMML